MAICNPKSKKTKLQKAINDLEIEFPYLVDCPNPFSDEWMFMASFKTKKEAIKYAQEQFGADKDGKASLVSKLI